MAEFTDPRGRKWRPKTRRSSRWIPLGARSARAIKKLIEKYAESWYLLPAITSDGLFSPRGENWLQTEFDTLREKTIERYPWTETLLRMTIGDTGRYAITLHSFRHTYASQLLQGGFAIHLVGQLMGHSDHFVTERYAKFAQSNLMEAAHYLDRRRIGTEAGTAQIIKMANS